MVNPQLISYIKNQLTKGYNINSIKLSLARSGYTPEQIEAAVESAYGQPKRNFTKTLLLVGGGAVLLAAVIATLILLFSGGGGEIEGPVSQIQTKDVSLSLVLGQEVIKPGEDLVFEVRIVNAGSGSNFAVGVRNEIFNSAGNKIAGKEEVISLSVQERKTYEIPLNVPEGDYELKTTVEYDNKEKFKTAEFSVSEEEVVVEEFETLTGGAVERINDIKDTAERDFVQAKNLCLNLETVVEKDTCLFEVGVKTNQAEVCAPISDDDKRDSCYVNVALSLKNYNICNSIVNTNLKNACLALG